MPQEPTPACARRQIASVAYPVPIKPIDDFPGYWVGIDGSVWRIYSDRDGKEKRYGHPLVNKWRRIAPQVNTSGYVVVGLWRDGRNHAQLVHRLVLKAFVGPSPEGMEACHNDGDPANCSLENLRWDTRSANQLDRRLHGTANQGSRNGASKLNEFQVLEIKRLLSRGTRGCEIARRFGVGEPLICNIKLGRTWTHVRLEEHGDLLPPEVAS